ncbi:MAG TPA: hypothetical protein VMV27_14665 [Candidatus Binataceae bacterium]|nr:hypothetical protein [Candidatus Binataceae bacterium]
MRCIYCRNRAGFIRKVCPCCAKVIIVVERCGGEVGIAGLVDLFIAEGLEREQVDAVLDAKIGSAPTIRDRLTSNLTNALMQGLGMPGRQSPEDVQRVREAMQQGAGAGAWSGGETPPRFSQGSP